MIKYKKLTNHQLTIVFDGWKGIHKESLSSIGGLRIIFSGIGENADEVIKRIICEDNKQWIVVSSDREIASNAWRCNCIPLNSELFTRKIKSSMREYIHEESDADHDDINIEMNKTKKGKAKMLSKKDKAVKLALSKL